ncbi:MAG: 23S rRNA (guanosine(2251)-2'-O)-methyltransferase RlmB [Proteobacteria bacterium]|nr:23S rRNA (guanosine(2251)-2'-O)-methyltransferase RlmB [Pseudomonadota bacterium]MBU1736543.1 23S rRNA (guanosine(2251)-2'-O)-methyltransferase RlmB [Pseudomonadota bacterium]
MPPANHTLIWGIHPVTELLRDRPEMVSEITIQTPGKSENIRKLTELAAKNRIRIHQTAKIVVPGEENPNHQGVVARLHEFRFAELGDLLEDLPASGFLVALDSIQDPHNLGAIIRSAAAAGCGGLLIPKDRSATITGTVAKVAAGALSHIRICQVTNLATSLQTLKDAGYWIFGADGHADKTIYETDFTGPSCLVIGSEGKGIRPLVKKNCDQLVKIPMSGTIESLNASVAAGIVIFEIVRQQKNY